MAAGGILGAYFSAKASISFTSDLRKDVFSRVQQFSFKNIDDFSTGSLVTRLTNDIQQVQNVMMMGLRLMLRAPGMLIGALFMAFWMNARLAVIILIVIPLLTAAIATILKLAFPRFEIMQKKLDRLNNGIQEVLTNVRVVKSFVREDYECKKFKEMNADLKESRKQSSVTEYFSGRKVYITSKEVKVISAQGIILSKSKSGAILKMTVYQDGKEIYQNTVSVPDSENNTKSIQYTNIKN